MEIEIYSDLVEFSNTEKVRLTKAVPTDYIHKATSDNTRKAYRQDVQHFEQWGGKLPTDTSCIIRYLHDHATLLNPRTLKRRITALKQFHLYQGFADPTAHPAVQKTLTGIQNTHGKPKQQAPALRVKEVEQAIQYLSHQDDLLGIRNCCLLSIGFFGALRGSELLGIRLENIDWQEKGMSILIPQSKTDQAGEGQNCTIPILNNAVCPVMHTKRWIEASAIASGYLFPTVNRWRQIGDKPMSLASLNAMLKKLARDCQWSGAEYYSSHSLRRGLATSASAAGASFKSIMRQGRWRHEGTVLQYIEEGQAYEDNAVNALFAPEKCEVKA